MTRRYHASAFVAALTMLSPTLIAAQSDLGLPVHQQSNLLAPARSPLYFQPWVPAHPGTRLTVALDYANIYELGYGYAAGKYVQDLELANIRLAATRDLSQRTFVMVDLAVDRSWAGTLDGFLKWWHGLLGIQIPERDLRPENRFGYRLVLPNGDSLTRPPVTTLGDLRLGLGRRIAPNAQLLATVTLPTTTATGYGKRVVSAGAILTGWTDLDPRVRVEWTMGLGYTPRTEGALRPYQRTVFGSVGGGFRWRFYRNTSMFGTIWWHSSYYHSTYIKALDGNDMAFDFGWIFRTKRGAEWRVGMTEDPMPSGPGVDAVFKASRSW